MTGLKDWIIARGIVKLMDREDFDEKLTAMMEALDKKLTDQFKEKDSEAIQDQVVKKLLVICRKLKEEDHERLKTLFLEVMDEKTP